VTYGADGSRFLGATFDPVGLYRFNAVMDWCEQTDLSVEAINRHVHALQRRFVQALDGLGLAALHSGQLVVPIEAANRGHFLTFRTPEAAAIQRRLKEAKVVTDRRGDRLRFGFGLYHDAEDIDRLCRRLRQALA
jgi:selenocysteine lyase/cysteine desulfurase